MKRKLETTGAELREVTGWDEIDFVGDDDAVVVHFGHSGSPYALWTDANGVAQTLGNLTPEELNSLGSRQQDAR